jgi:hypothetical protein
MEHKNYTIFKGKNKMRERDRESPREREKRESGKEENERKVWLKFHSAYLTRAKIKV